MCEKVTCVCSVSELVLFPILKDLLAEFPIDRMKRWKRSRPGIYLFIHLSSSSNLLCVCIRDILFSTVFIKVQKYSGKKKCVIEGTIYIPFCMWGCFEIDEFNIHPKAYICVSHLQPLIVAISIKCHYETVLQTDLEMNALQLSFQQRKIPFMSSKCNSNIILPFSCEWKTIRAEINSKTGVISNTHLV